MCNLSKESARLFIQFILLLLLLLYKFVWAIVNVSVSAFVELVTHIIFTVYILVCVYTVRVTSYSFVFSVRAPILPSGIHTIVYTDRGMEPF